MLAARFWEESSTIDCSVVFAPAAVFFSQVQSVAHFAVFVVFAVFCLQLRRLVRNQNLSATAPFFPWLLAFLSSFAVGSLFQTLLIPQPLRWVSPVALFASLGFAIVTFHHLRPIFASGLKIDKDRLTVDELMPSAEQLEAVQRRLDSTERNLDLVLDGGQIGLWEWDVQSNDFSVSSSFCKLLRQPASQTWRTIEDWRACLHEADREAAFSELNSFANEDSRGYEASYRMTTPDGTTVWLLCRARLVRGGNGVITGVHGIAIDVTQQKQTRQQLRLNETALAMSPEAVLFLTSSGRVFHANDAAVTMLHRSKEHLCGLTIFDIDIARSPETWAEHWTELQKAEAYRAAATFLGPDDRQLSCETQERVVLFEGHRFVVLSIKDVSVRKRRERERRRHEFATERATEAVFWAYEDGRFFYVNKAACRLLGYPKGELLNMRVSDVNQTLSAEGWAQQWELVKQKRSMPVETVHRARSGQVLQIAMNLHFYEVEGEQFVVGAARDITREKLAAEALADRTAELEHLFSLLPLGMVLVNPDREIVRVNSEFCRMFDYEEHEVIGQSSRMFYVDYQSFDTASGYQAELSQEPKAKRFFIDFRKKGGEIIRTEVFGVALKNSEGTVTGYLTLLQDDTERWAIERSLRRTQAALDTAADAVLWIDQHGSIFYANRVACERLQFSKNQLERMTVADINPALNSPEDFTRGFWPEIQRKGQITVELTHRRRDGSEFPVEIVSHIQQFEGEEFACSFIRDLTERHQARDLLLEAQAKLEIALQSGNVSLWEWNVGTGDVNLSDACHRLVGEPAGTIKTLEQWKDRLHPDDSEVESRLIQDMVDSDKVGYDRTYRIRHRDGSYRWILSRGRMYRYATGTAHRLVGTHVDITDLRNAQLRIESYVNLVGTTDGGWDWAVDSDDVIYSPRFFELLKFDESAARDVPGTIQFLQQQIHSEDRDAFWQNIDSHFRTRKFFDHEVRLRLHGGDYRWFRFRAQTSYDSLGRPVRMAGAIYDVTEHKKVELQLRRSHADLEQFAYVASHDLQEPLRAISGFCQLLKMKYHDLLDDKGREYIDHAVGGASQMKKLIEGLLNYARIGREREGPKLISLTACAAEAVALLEPVITEADAVVQVDELPTVEGYSDLLVQMFQMLISNSIKFRQPGRNPKVTVSGTHDETCSLIQVIDNGMGIEKGYQEQIFHLFQRLHFSDAIPGTGLGLAISKRIVDRHGGSIDVASKLGEGSTFTITLPWKERG